MNPNCNASSSQKKKWLPLFLLITGGILINVVGARLALFFRFPLFLDPIGTVLAAVLGGLPITGGAKVRFSNIVFGTLMYTILNNGLVMMGFESQTQQLIKGVIFLLFVALTIDRKALKVIK